MSQIYSTSSTQSSTYINGELVNNESAVTESDGNNLEFMINNNNNIVTGGIDHTTLKEDELLQLLNYPVSKKPLLERLSEDWPVTTSPKSTKVTKKRRKRRAKATKKKN